MNHVEEEHQIMFFNCLRIMVINKELDPTIEELTFAVPNGGFRAKAEASRLKKQGVKAGIPDIYCDVARKEYHGLRIELKRPIVKGSGKPPVTADQQRKMRLLNSQGYLAIVCYGYQEALETYMTYLGITSKTFPLSKI
jgi:hypothetical protein